MNLAFDPAASISEPRRFDVCNGDADGLSAAIQWRLHAPGVVTLVTGLKREIELLDRVPVQQADEVNVFDLSMQRNQAALTALLAAGVRVRWFDHHAAPAVPVSDLLEAHLEMRATWCSSLLVDQALGGAYRAWALVGAYGDNLERSAQARARQSGLDAAQCAALRRMGMLLNYNAYGDSLADVLIHPAALYESMRHEPDPLVWAQGHPLLTQLEARWRDDWARARRVPIYWSNARVRVVVLPDAPWAARMMGTLANQLATEAPSQAHAVLKHLASENTYRVSMRAPQKMPRSASAVCSAFGGTGRAAAAGIDGLPADALPALLAAMARAW